MARSSELYPSGLEDPAVDVNIDLIAGSLKLFDRLTCAASSFVLLAADGLLITRSEW